MLHLFRTILAARYNLLRFALAAFLLVVVATDSAARFSRLRLAGLPDFDYSGEVARLRAEGRFGEAVMVADAGLAELSGDAHTALQHQRQSTLDEQSSWLRRVKDAGFGALSGQGTTVEGLAGAVTADLFIVGDIRDLLIQGSKLAIDGETDPVILSLSAIGIATTLAPEIDWVPSLLKVARKTGALSARMGDSIIDMAKASNHAAARSMLKDVAILSEKASPAGALRLLRHADDPKDVEKLASFLRTEKSGAFILHITGKEGATFLRLADSSADTAILLKAAARKGPAGVSWLRSAGRTALKPHWVIGLAKGVYKGNVQTLAARVAERFDPHGWWIIPSLAAWTLLEGWWLSRRFALAPTPLHTPAAVPPLAT